MELMMQLPASQLDKLRDTFEQHPCRGLSLHEFVALLVRFVQPRGIGEAAQVQMAVELAELFRNVDINGDGRLTWEEFTSHCVEAGMAATRRFVKPLAYHFRESLELEDRAGAVTQRAVRLLQYCSPLDLLLVCEVESPCMKLVCPETLELTETIDTSCALEGEGALTSIMCAAYCSELKLLIIGSSGRAVSFWRTDELGACHKYCGRLRSGAVHALHAEAASTRLFTAGDRGRIKVWQLMLQRHDDYFRCLALPRGRLREGHSGLVTCFEAVPRYRLLATASMDSTVLLWDTEKLRRRAVLRGHARGVRFVSFAKQADLLLTAGFEPEVLCWDLRSYHVIVRLVGHRATLVGLALTETNKVQQAVTGDETGTFRVWELHRTTSGEADCAQVFESEAGSAYRSRFTPRCFVSVARRKPSRRMVVAAGSAFRVFASARTAVREFLPSAARYNAVSRAFYVVLGSHIEVWDALSGTLRDVLYHCSQHEITAFCFDDHKRKLVVGNAHGEVRVCNALSGELIKMSVVPKNAAVVGMGYFNADRTVVVVTADRSLLVYDDNANEEHSEPVNLHGFICADHHLRLPAHCTLAPLNSIRIRLSNKLTTRVGLKTGQRRL